MSGIDLLQLVVSIIAPVVSVLMAMRIAVRDHAQDASKRAVDVTEVRVMLQAMTVELGRLREDAQDVRELNALLGRLQQDLTELRTELRAMREAHTVLDHRLVVLEQRSSNPPLQLATGG